MQLFRKSRKPGMEAHACNPGTWEVQARRPGVQNHPCLCSRLEVNLRYTRPCLKKEKERVEFLVMLTPPPPPNVNSERRKCPGDLQVTKPLWS